MKKILVLISMWILGASTALKAQTWDEWFKQRKTQKKYMLEQILKLQLYIGHVKKGYDIVQGGLNTIGAIKDGDFKLHDLFFSDLKRVKPLVRQHSQADQAYNDYQSILAVIEKVSRLQDGLQTERPFILRQLNNMRESLLNDMNDLADVLRSGTLEMNDHERVERIATLAGRVAEKKEWVISLHKHCLLLSHQRLKLADEYRNLQELY